MNGPDIAEPALDSTMNTKARYFLVVLAVVLTIHFILSFVHEPYIDSVSQLSSHIPGIKKRPPKVVYDETYDPFSSPEHKANATFVVLARNNDLAALVGSVRDMEERFNRKYRYPYVFLNEEPFTWEFIKRISALSDAKMEFGIIPKQHWVQPAWVDEDKAKKSRDKLSSEGVMYGGSLSYRNMCRFNSGFFFKHHLLEKYRWYWRIEPDVHFHCDVDYDPFMFMEQNNKTYGFTLTLYEFDKTIPTLWAQVKEFTNKHPEYVAKDNSMGYISETNGDTYNNCHFWSNFEIADMDFWRSPAYQDFFQHLESSGGFYYERWGDAPVHSIAAALFLQKDRIHFFNDMGYEHNPYTHCPTDPDIWKKRKCSCDPKESFDHNGYSCLWRWTNIH